MKDRHELAEAIFTRESSNPNMDPKTAYSVADAFIIEREKQKGVGTPLQLGDRVVMTTGEYEGCIGTIENFARYIEVRLDAEHNGETLVYCKTEELKCIPTPPAAPEVEPETRKYISTGPLTNENELWVAMVSPYGPCVGKWVGSHSNINFELVHNGEFLKTLEVAQKYLDGLAQELGWELVQEASNENQ